MCQADLHTRPWIKKDRAEGWSKDPKQPRDSNENRSMGGWAQWCRLISQTLQSSLISKQDANQLLLMNSLAGWSWTGVSRQEWKRRAEGDNVKDWGHPRLSTHVINHGRLMSKYWEPKIKPLFPPSIITVCKQNLLLLSECSVNVKASGEV